MADLRSEAVSAAQAYGVPPGVFVSQIDYESGFQNVAGAAGEFGPGQFMPGTWSMVIGQHPEIAQRFGVSADPADRANATANVWAAAAHMGDLLAHFGDIGTALAAYNAGAGNVSAGAGYARRVLGMTDFPDDGGGAGGGDRAAHSIIGVTVYGYNGDKLGIVRQDPNTHELYLETGAKTPASGLFSDVARVPLRGADTFYLGNGQVVTFNDRGQLLGAPQSPGRNLPHTPVEAEAVDHDLAVRMGNIETSIEITKQNNDFANRILLEREHYRLEQEATDRGFTQTMIRDAAAAERVKQENALDRAARARENALQALTGLQRNVSDARQQANELLARTLGEDPIRAAAILGGGVPTGTTPAEGFRNQLAQVANQPDVQIPPGLANATAPEANLIATNAALRNPTLPTPPPYGMAGGGTIRFDSPRPDTAGPTGVAVLVGDGVNNEGTRAGTAEVLEIGRQGVRVIPLLARAPGGMTATMPGLPAVPHLDFGPGVPTGPFNLPPDVQQILQAPNDIRLGNLRNRGPAGEMQVQPSVLRDIEGEFNNLARIANGTDPYSVRKQGDFARNLNYQIGQYRSMGGDEATLQHYLSSLSARLFNPALAQRVISFVTGGAPVSTLPGETPQAPPPLAAPPGGGIVPSPVVTPGPPPTVVPPRFQPPVFGPGGAAGESPGIPPLATPTTPQTPALSPPGGAGTAAGEVSPAARTFLDDLSTRLQANPQNVTEIDAELAGQQGLPILQRAISAFAAGLIGANQLQTAILRELSGAGGGPPPQFPPPPPGTTALGFLNSLLTKWPNVTEQDAYYVRLFAGTDPTMNKVADIMGDLAQGRIDAATARTQLAQYLPGFKEPAGAPIDPATGRPIYDVSTVRNAISALYTYLGIRDATPAGLNALGSPQFDQTNAFYPKGVLSKFSVTPKLFRSAETGQVFVSDGAKLHAITSPGVASASELSFLGFRPEDITALTATQLAQYGQESDSWLLGQPGNLQRVQAILADKPSTPFPQLAVPIREPVSGLMLPALRDVVGLMERIKTSNPALYGVLINAYQTALGSNTALAQLEAERSFFTPGSSGGQPGALQPSMAGILG